jgi:putative ATP-dependent endonuclease of OLD family
MRTVSLQIRNFRCLRDVTIQLSPLTALIGPNGTGKSAVIRALEFLFGERQVDDRDCWGGDPGLSIEVSITVGPITEAWKDRLAAFLDENDYLELTKRSEAGDGSRRIRFLTVRRQVPEFTTVRRASNAEEMKTLYPEVKAEARFSELPSATTKKAILEALDEFERSHPELLEEYEDESLSIGPGGEINLAPLFYPVFVRAVQDASSEAAEGPRNVLGQLVELLVRPHLAFGEPLGQLQEKLQDRYRRIVTKDVSVLRRREKSLSRRLNRWAPGAGVRLSWDHQLPQIASPKVKAELEEAGFSTEIGRQGHGVQRAYILSLLQELASIRAEKTDESSEPPHILLAIEEPELYQHPGRARLLAKLLAELALDRGQAPIQVVYATHSPFFVSLEQVDSLRLLRLRRDQVPPETVVAQVDLDKAADELREASQLKAASFTAETLRARLKPLTEMPVAEGFFAQAVVLVEGEEDRAFLMAQAQIARANLDEEGIEVIPVGGKGNLDKPLSVFRQLGIPTYILFDGDRHKKKKDRDAKSNLRLLRLLGGSETEDPDTLVEATYACFEDDLARTVANEIGDGLAEATMAVCRTLGFTVETGKKNPMVLARALQRLSKKGKTSTTLSKIMEQISSLAGPGP